MGKSGYLHRKINLFFEVDTPWDLGSTGEATVPICSLCFCHGGPPESFRQS